MVSNEIWDSGRKKSVTDCLAELVPMPFHFHYHHIFLYWELHICLGLDYTLIKVLVIFTKDCDFCQRVKIWKVYDWIMDRGLTEIIPTPVTRIKINTDDRS